MAKFCHNCGSPVREGTAFCGKCGTKLDTTPVSAPAPEVAPEPVAEAIPAVEPAPVAETVPAIEPVPIVEPAPAVEPVAEPVPAVEPVAEPVPVAVAPEAEPVAAVEPVVEAVPVAAPYAAPVEAAPYAAPVEATPYAAPAEPTPYAAPVEANPYAAPVEASPYAAPAPEMPVDAVPAAVEPIAFEAPSGSVTETPVTAAPEAPKKKGKGGLIAILVAVGVVMLALIGVGAWALINGGFGGTIIERIEKKDKVESGKRYTIYDEDFNDYIIEARWWDYDSTMGKPGMYTTDTETLAFSIEVNDDAEDKIYYAYYYSKDKEFDKDDLEKPLYSTTISPEEFGDGRIFYNVDCSKKIQKGYYVVVVASDDSLKRPYIVAYADVK